MIRPDSDIQPFAESHPIRVAVPGGPPLRFQTLMCAARSALEYKTGMFDESHCKPYSNADCIRIVNGSWPHPAIRTGETDAIETD